MPSLVTNAGDSYWFVTALDGPWQVFTSMVTSAGMYKDCVGMVNIATGIAKIYNGKKQGGGWTNPFMSAERAAEKRNLKERRRASKAGHLGYNHQYARAEIIEALTQATTMPGAACYEAGASGMARRLEEINKVVGKALEIIREIDMAEAEDAGVMNTWAVLNIREEIEPQRGAGQ